MQFNVLLIGKDTKQTEIYASLIRDMVECHIDVMSRIEGAMNWVSRMQYHLVVIDHPEATMLLERMKRVHPESSVIVISSEGSIEDAVSTIRLGAEDFLKKPINLDRFRVAVRRGIDRKALFDEDGVYSRYLNLVNSCQMISASIEEVRVFGIVRSYLSRELRSQNTGVFTLGEGGAIEWADLEKSDESGMEEIFEITLKSNNVVKELQNGSFFRFCERTATSPALFAMRFRCVDEKDYYFVSLSPKKPEPPLEFESRMKILRAQIEVTGQNIRRYRDVQQMAYVDDVTGLHNTRYMNFVIDREITKAKASGIPFTILFVDVDKFKLVNDSHGHLYGSKILSEIGQKLKGFVRDSDSLVRYGGDEFVAILSPADLKTGKMVAERIRKSIEKWEFLKEDGLNLKITVSIGVAVFPEHASTKEEIIKAADHAMYAAKNKSRNSVYVANMRQEDGHHA